MTVTSVNQLTTKTTVMQWSLHRSRFHNQFTGAEPLVGGQPLQVRGRDLAFAHANVGANLKSCGNWAPAGACVKERRTLPAQHTTPGGEMNWRDTPWREDTTAQPQRRRPRPSTTP